MTVTSVKDAGSVLSSLTTNVAAKSAASVQGASFQSVWDNQAKGGSAQPSPKAKEEAQDAAKPGDSLKAKDVRNVKPAKEKESISKAGETEEAQTPEDLEEAMEVLGTAAMELLNRIAGTLGMDVQNLQETLSDMELEPVDLLDTAALNTFLFKVMGAEDAAALLTNEEMYQDFSKLMGELETMLAGESGINSMNLGELKEQLANSIGSQPDGEAGNKLPTMAEALQASAEASKKEPAIEVTVEGASPEGDAEDAMGVEESQLKEGADTSGQAKEQGSGRAGEKHFGDKGQANPFVPDHTQNANPNLQNVQSARQPMAAWDVDTQDIMRQIMDYMRISVKPDMSQLEMQLHPANLGTLQIHVASKGGVLTANFVAQNEAVKAALESQMVQLKENFTEQGVKVEAIEVTVQTHQFEENLEQGQQKNQGSSEKKPRTRRIALDGPLTMEELSGMDGEERLAAEMMAANGSTVEYTA